MEQQDAGLGVPGKKGFRGKGVGTLLMNKAVEVAREKGGRMVVLETQS